MARVRKIVETVAAAFSLVVLCDQYAGNIQPTEPRPWAFLFTCYAVTSELPSTTTPESQRPIEASHWPKLTLPALSYLPRALGDVVLLRM